MVEIDNNSTYNGDNDDKRINDPADDRDVIDVEEARLLKIPQNGITPKNGLKKNEKSEQDRTTTEEINKLLRDMPLSDDMTCGFWIFRGKFFQR